MIFVLIFLCCTYYIWTVMKKRHPNCIVNVQRQIMSKTPSLSLDAQHLYRLIISRWFPEISNVTGPNNGDTNTSEVQKLDVSSTTNTTVLCNKKEKDISEVRAGENSTKIINNTVVGPEMALILDDTILEKLLCSLCGKYLSVLPIKVYENDIVKCGRCCKDNDGGVISHLYENVAKSCLFKCINRYERCTQLLTLFEIDDHERECISNTYDCPKCESNRFSGSGYELFCHYKDEHPNSILQRNTFYIDTRAMPIKERYLYLKNDIVFFILVEIVNRENSRKSLYLSVVSLTQHEDIKQQFNLKFLSEPVKRTQTESKVCSSLQTFDCDYFKIEISNTLLEKIKCKVDIHIPEEIITLYQIPKHFKELEETPVASTSTQTLPPEQITNIKITDQFKQQYPDYKVTPCGTALFAPGDKRIELICSKCKFFTGTNVFSCINCKDIMCWECRTKQCKCKTGTGSWNADISTINELLLLPCRWNCGQTFPGDGLRNHEAQCWYN